MRYGWRGRLKGLPKGFLKFPKWLRFALGIGGVVAVLAAFVIPGEVLLGAVLAFGAIFSGASLSFWLDRRRQEAEEKSLFARCIKAIKVESGVNEGMLRGILKDAKPGHVPVSEMRTEALHTALNNPVFYKWADESLVVTTTAVRTELSSVNNLLTMYRDTLAAGQTFTEKTAQKLRVRAEANLERLRAMEKPLNEALRKFPPPSATERPSSDVRESLKGIAQWQNEKLAGICADKSAAEEDHDGHQSPAMAETGEA